MKTDSLWDRLRPEADGCDMLSDLSLVAFGDKCKKRYSVSNHVGGNYYKE